MATRATAVSQGELLADGAYREAMQRAGHLLATRPRTEYEIRSRLSTAGFTADAVERAVTRLVQLELIDDHDFARRWIEERAETKGRSPEALKAELEAKGIDRHLAEEALAESGLDEEEQAKQVAMRLAPRVASRPLAAQGVALKRMLLQRGFSEEAAEAGARAVLPPEGWD